jgi:serine/threonine protein kinase
VLWPDEHQAFLIDFGIAAFMPIPGSKNRGWVEVYSPPEQQPPDRKRLVPQNDFYSLGMTMLFMINKDMNLVRDKKIPKSLPEPVLQFIRRMIRANPDDRPNWANEDIEATLLEVRQQAFNQTRSGFASIPDWRDKLAYSSR